MRGLLFTSEGLDEQWARLDEFEGDGYARVVTEAVLPNGRTVEAFSYEQARRHTLE